MHARKAIAMLLQDMKKIATWEMHARKAIAMLLQDMKKIATWAHKVLENTKGKLF